MSFAIGLSAIRASQFAINTSAHNLANANTLGYHRQRVEMSSRAPQWLGGQWLGTGVDVKNVSRLRNQVLEAAFTHATSNLSHVRERLTVARQIEAQFLPETGALHDRLAGLFAELGKLSANPSESVSAMAAIEQGVLLANQVTSTFGQINSLKQNVNSQIFVEVDALNRQIEELVQLQNQIKRGTFTGPISNDLLDRRDQLINQLAEKIDVHRFEQLDGGMALTLGDSSISLGSIPVRVEAVYQNDGTLALQIANSQRQVRLSSGSIHSLLELNNGTLNHYQDRLNQFASSLMNQFDQVHAKGIGTSGSFDLLRSTRPLSATDQPIDQAGLLFPVKPGEWVITVTDPDGQLSNSFISIDPSIDSIEDVAQRINQLNHLHASVDPQNGQLSILAEPGYRFDFTGRLETQPRLDNISGTVVPRISGNYTGNINRQIEVTFVGTGTVGQTAGLLAQVTDPASGIVIGEIEIGTNYEAGKPVEVLEGVFLSFSGGTINDGDSFTTNLIANSDSTGILSALGLNSFFQGTNASDIRVSSAVLNNPGRLAVSRTGDRADTSNLLQLINVRDQPIAGSDRMTLLDFVSDISADIGFEVRSLQVQEVTLSTLRQEYEMEINAISGVDINEELIIINQYQRQYEAAVQVLRTMDNMLAELMRIVG